jgi:hypothetical protein
VILSDLYDFIQTKNRRENQKRYFGCREPKAGLPGFVEAEGKSGQRKP